MISKSGRYWSIGITVTYIPLAGHLNNEPHSGWHAKLNYRDGIANNDPATGQIAIQGTLYTRYPVHSTKIRSGLSIALDTLIADAKRLGIEFRAATPGTEPWLFYQGDGEDADYPPPDGWRETLAAEAVRVGFRSYTIAPDAVSTGTSAQEDDAQARREKNTTCEGILVRPGQIWENLDTRLNNRHVVVESVADGEAQVRDHYSTARSTLSVSRMHTHPTGLRLVPPGELKYGARATVPDERAESR
ncbi:hypothetical protein [Streptomyces tsukubensis]|uniref:hypothetical protein n=1 Tax=Streptomyces tsukubensis TaxID=83656 RepID=UPI00344FF8B6